MQKRMIAALATDLDSERGDPLLHSSISAAMTPLQREEVLTDL
jgi:hypothetical protein